jgi:hypothetical protein
MDVEPQRKVTALAIALFIIAGFLVFGWSMGGAFVYDDMPLIVNNAFIRSFENIGKIFTTDLHYFGSAAHVEKIKYYRPFLALTFMMDYFLWGMDTLGYHLTNILIHVCNAILIFFLARTLKQEARVGIIAALLFMVHPIHSESVTHIAGRMDPISLFFTMTALLFFIRHLERHTMPFSTANILSALSLIPAFLTRESNLVIMLILIMYLLVYPEGKARRSGVRMVTALLPHAIVFVSYAAVRFGIVGLLASEGQMGDPLGIRLLTLPAVIVEYLSILAFPRNLHMNRSFTHVLTIADPRFLVSLAIVGLVVFVVVRASRKDRFVRFSALWIVISYLPFSAILLPLATYVAEHWIHVSLVGICFLISTCIVKTLDRFKSSPSLTRGIWAAFGIAVIGYSIATIRLTFHWRSEETLYAWINQCEAKDYRGLINLGSIKLRQGSYDEAITTLNAALDNLPKSGLSTELGKNHFALVYKLLGDCYAGKNDPATAQTYYEKAIATYPKQGEAYNELGRLYLRQGEPEKAIEAYKKSIEYSPYNWVPHANLASAYQSRGDLRRAQNHWEKVLEINPGFEPAVKALNGIKRRQ